MAGAVVSVLVGVVAIGDSREAVMRRAKMVAGTRQRKLYYSDNTQARG
jgi:hypothetical protein